MTEHNNNPAPGPGFFQVLQSIAGAAFGVQSRHQREQDFGSGSPIPFVVGGVLFTLVFIGVLLFFVQLSLG